MRLFLLLSALAVSAQAQHAFYACMVASKQYFVGSRLPESGLFRLNKTAWRHLGFNQPYIHAVDYDSRDPSTLYLAAGNGLIRATNSGQKWTVLTGSDVTELRDVAVDRHADNTIYFAHSAGIRMSRDAGMTWQEIGTGLHRRYTEALRVDREHAGILLAGGEEGIFRSPDFGKTWKLAGANGFQVLNIEQSPHDACYWLATTQEGGLFASRDCGTTFENVGNVGVGRNLYHVTFDAADRNRVALAGWGFGIAISLDGGKTWQFRNQGLPRIDAWSVAFDPDTPGRLYASVHEEALYVSNDAGVSWVKSGLADSAVSDLKFVPEPHK